MNSAEIVSLIEELGDGIDEVEEDLEPLIRDTLSATTKKLPLLEKAKLHVLIVYAIESLIFSTHPSPCRRSSLT
jgi:exosome complex protein LRP1